MHDILQVDDTLCAIYPQKWDTLVQKNIRMNLETPKYTKTKCKMKEQQYFLSLRDRVRQTKKHHSIFKIQTHGKQKYIY